MIGFKTRKIESLVIGDLVVNNGAMVPAGSCLHEVIGGIVKNDTEASYMAPLFVARVRTTGTDGRVYEQTIGMGRGYRLLVGTAGDYLQEQQRRRAERPQWNRKEWALYRTRLQAYDKDHHDEVVRARTLLEDGDEAGYEAVAKPWSDAHKKFKAELVASINAVARERVAQALSKAGIAP